LLVEAGAVEAGAADAETVLGIFKDALHFGQRPDLPAISSGTFVE
jgi:hypothetical protein